MRLWALALVAVFALGGCGTASSATSPSPVGSSPPSGAVVRELKAGDRVSLESGLSATIPAHYDGYLVTGDAAHTGGLDSLASRRSPKAGLVQSFTLQSLTPETERQAAGPLQLPLVARAADGSVEVRAAGDGYGTASGIATIAVIVRKPGQPTALATMAVFGKQASRSPKAVLAQAAAMWKAFAIEGAALPGAKE